MVKSDTDYLQNMAVQGQFWAKNSGEKVDRDEYMVESHLLGFQSGGEALCPLCRLGPELVASDRTM